MQTNIIPAGTGAAESIPFEVTGPVLVGACGTLGSDTGDIQRQATNGIFVALYNAGEQVQVKAASPQVAIDAPGIYKVVFSARAAAIGVDKQPYPA